MSTMCFEFISFAKYEAFQNYVYKLELDIENTET